MFIVQYSANMFEYFSLKRGLIIISHGLKWESMCMLWYAINDWIIPWKWQGVFPWRAGNPDTGGRGSLCVVISSSNSSPVA